MHYGRLARSVAFRVRIFAAQDFSSDTLIKQLNTGADDRFRDNRHPIYNNGGPLTHPVLLNEASMHHGNSSQLNFDTRPKSRVNQR